MGVVRVEVSGGGGGGGGGKGKVVRTNLPVRGVTSSVGLCFDQCMWIMEVTA